MLSGKLSELIAIHSSDDVWEPHKLKEQVAFLDKTPQIGAVFTNALLIGENGEPLSHRSDFDFLRIRE